MKSNRSELRRSERDWHSTLKGRYEPHIPGNFPQPRPPRWWAWPFLVPGYIGRWLLFKLIGG